MAVDLIEIHVTGGPWSQAEADELAGEITNAIQLNVSGVETYVADTRGADDGPGDDQ